VKHQVLWQRNLPWLHELRADQRRWLWDPGKRVLWCFDRRRHCMNGMITGFGMSEVTIIPVSRAVEPWKISEMHLRWSDTCLKKNERHIIHSSA
jgi:hypothetical protein